MVLDGDLIGATLVMLAACLAVGLLGAWLTFGASPKRRMAVHGAAVAFSAFYGLFLFDRPILAALFPVTSLIIFGNWWPVCASFLVGSYLTSVDKISVRELSLSSAAAVMSAISLVSPIIGVPPDCESTTERLALQPQTSPYTCSAACGVTLLRLHGIQATEQELASLCLTRRGTHWMGLYRALKLKTEGSNWRVEVLNVDSSSHRNLPSGPAILALNFDTSAFTHALDHGFSDQAGHSVVSLGPASNSIDVFDPSPGFGIERWGDSIWRATTGGHLLRLVPVEDEVESNLAVNRMVNAARSASYLAAR